MSTEDSLPKKKNDHRKQLISDRKKITSANKSFLHQAKHMKTDEDSTCMPSQSTVSENHQVIANSNIDVNAKTTNESNLKKKKNYKYIVRLWREWAEGKRIWR